MYNFFATNKLKRSSTTKRTQDQLDINLTPMLDVVMILLIFFIVTSSFVREITIDFDRKQTANTSSSKPSDNIIFTIGPENQIWFDQRKIDPLGTRAIIQRLHAENPKADVIIRAHGHSAIQVVAGVVDSSRQAGVFNVSVESVN